MSLRNNIIPITLVTVCGIFTAVATFQPELKKEQDEKLGHIEFPRPSLAEVKPAPADNAISQAISQDFKEAAEELRSRGFGWAIRDALFGAGTRQTQKGEANQTIAGQQK